MKALFTIGIFQLAITIGLAQTFQRTFGDTTLDQGKFVLPVSDGGFLILSEKRTSQNDWDIVIIKTNSSGNIIWQRTFGSTGYDNANWAVENTGGDFTVSGYSSMPNGNNKGLLFNISSSGNLNWAKNYGTLGSEAFYSGAKTSDGGYILTGASILPSAALFDVFLVRTDGSGNQLWSKYYGGGMGSLGGFSVAESPEGGFGVCGYIEGSGAGLWDLLFLKTDNSGNLLNTVSYGGTGYDLGQSIVATSDSGFVIAGFSGSFGMGGADGYVIKVSKTGSLIWNKSYGNFGIDALNYCTKTIDGGFIFSGFTDNNSSSSFGVLLKTDILGNPTWQKAYGPNGNGELLCVKTTSDGGYIASGNTSSFSQGNMDVFLVRTDPTGNSWCSDVIPVLLPGIPTPIMFTPILSSGNRGGESAPAFSLLSNGFTDSTICFSNVGLNENTLSTSFVLSLFPNPTQNKTTINANFEVNEFIVFDLLGKEYARHSPSGKNWEADFSNLPNGIYLIEARGETGSAFTKLILEK
jgi:hypothetical protein